MNYLFVCMSLLMSLTYVPMLGSRVNREQCKEGYKNTFKNQTPNQRALFLKTRSNWYNYLKEKQPDYAYYLPEFKFQIAENFAQYTDYQLQIRAYNDQIFEMTEKINSMEETVRKLEEEMNKLTRINMQIFKLEDKRLRRKTPVSEL